MVSLRCKPSFSLSIRCGRETRSLRAFGIYNLVLSTGIDILPIIIHIVSEVSYCSLQRDQRLLGAPALAGTVFPVDRHALADELVRRI